jgi:hypothetical protein
VRAGAQMMAVVSQFEHRSSEAKRDGQNDDREGNFLFPTIFSNGRRTLT